MNFSNNGTVKTPEATQYKLGLLGVTMGQFESLMQQLLQVQAALGHLTEKEVDRAAFVAETRFRLQVIEQKVAEHASDMKTSAMTGEKVRSEIQQLLRDLQDQIHRFPQLLKDQSYDQGTQYEKLRQEMQAKIANVEELPKELTQQWKGVTKFLGSVLIVASALWGIVQAVVWIYGKYPSP